jgi:hypothetical protein
LTINPILMNSTSNFLQVQRQTQSSLQVERNSIAVKQAFPKAVAKKKTNLFYRLLAFYNTLKLLFGKKPKQSTLDHELGHLLIHDLAGIPSLAITVIPRTIEDGSRIQAGVAFNLGKFSEEVIEQKNAGNVTLASQLVLKRMLALKAGYHFEGQLSPTIVNLFPLFTMVSSDIQRLEEQFHELCVLNPAYKNEGAKKKLFERLDQLNQVVFDAIPLSGLEAIRTSLRKTPTIIGAKACADFLKKHLKQEEGFDWPALSAHIDTELNKLAQVHT